MISNTDFLSELNPTQKSLSIVGRNSCVVKTTNKFTVTAPQETQCQCNRRKAPSLTGGNLNNEVYKSELNQ